MELKIRYIHIAWLCFLVMGCEREVADQDFRSELEQLTTHTRVYQGDSVRIIVGKTSPVLGSPGSDTLENAIITLRKNNRVIHQLSFNDRQIDYVVNREIELNDTLQLAVNSDGLSTLIATDIVQAPLLLDTIRYEFFNTRDRLRVKIRWFDPLTEDNYYVVSGEVVGKQELNVDTVGYRSPATIFDVSGLFIAGANNDLRNHYGVFQDVIFNGRKTQLTFELEAVVPNGRVEYVLVSFKKISEPYFRFLSDLMNQTTSIGGPFNSTQNVYTNTTGGLGVLACMEEVRDTAWVQ